MLTVLYRHNDGRQSLCEAVSVTRECNDAPSIPPCGDVLIHTGTDNLIGGPTCAGGRVEGEGVIRLSRRFFATEEDTKTTEHATVFQEARVFVMNRFGATVATYIL